MVCASWASRLLRGYFEIPKKFVHGRVVWKLRQELNETFGADKVLHLDPTAGFQGEKSIVVHKAPIPECALHKPEVNQVVHIGVAVPIFCVLDFEKDVHGHALGLGYRSNVGSDNLALR